MTNIKHNVMRGYISKASGDVCHLRGSSALSASYTEARSLYRKPVARKVTLAVVELTRGYERRVIYALEVAGVPVACLICSMPGINVLRAA